MSERFPGGIISKTAPVPTGPYETGTAPGIWTLDQQAEFVKQGIWPIAGLTPNYIEDVFSTWLYTGNDSTQTITNGIDLAGEGGMVWMKSRTDVASNALYDTVRGATKEIESNSTGAEATRATGLTAFNSNGFSIGSRATINSISQNYASWTFRKQPKFFDVVTYTGTGSQQSINHALGSVPGFIIVKRLDAASSYWGVYHRSLTDGYALGLNTTEAQFNAPSFFVNSASQTATQFTVGTSANVNDSGATYVAYLFAHDAGGFGESGEENVISCGSTTANGSGDFSVNLGYEPQWVLIKSTGSGIWSIVDNMRGATASSGYTSSQRLQPQSSAAEDTLNSGYGIGLNATGFTGNLATFSNDFIYIAIRRGPMKVPESGTSVFSPNTQTGAGTSAGQTITTNFPVDLVISSGRSDNSGGNAFVDRLRGGQNYIQATNTNAEVNFTSWTPLIGFANNTGITDANYGSTSASYVDWNFRRAPGFFDEVCDSTGGPTIYHNLGVAPELIIAKVRNYSPQNWFVDVPALGSTRTLNLNTTGAASSTNYISSPTATQFTTTLGGGGYDYVYYLFASAPGVSKVGSYTGTGTTLQINCGFTAGARFVLIKRTDSTGDWYVWDSARGIVAGNDPYLLLNTTDAEVTGTDYIDTYSAGFEITSTAPAAINASGGSFIFLAIA